MMLQSQKSMSISKSIKLFLFYAVKKQPGEQSRNFGGEAGQARDVTSGV